MKIRDERVVQTFQTPHTFAAVSPSFPVPRQEFNKRIIQISVSVSLWPSFERKSRIYVCHAFQYFKEPNSQGPRRKFTLRARWQSSLTHLFYIYTINFRTNLRIMIYLCSCIVRVKLSIHLLQLLAQCCTKIVPQDCEFATFFAARRALLLEKNSRLFVFTDGYGDSLG